MAFGLAVKERGSGKGVAARSGQREMVEDVCVNNFWFLPNR